jgi:hypothetical protein
MTWKNRTGIVSTPRLRRTRGRNMTLSSVSKRLHTCDGYQCIAENDVLFTLSVCCMGHRSVLPLL